jgi:SAM-dependent methyltransferase
VVSDASGLANGRDWQPARLLARLYDWEHDEFRADTDLYVQLARRSGGPVLELACGTGRVLAPLVEVGLEIVGVDRSEAMLERARARLARSPQRVCLVQADLSRDFDARIPERRYGLIILALDALGLLAGVTEQLRLLRRLRLRLAPHGMLALDVVHVAPLFDEPQGLPVLQHAGEDEESGASVIKWMVRRLLPATQQIDLLSIYDLTWSGGETRRLTEPLALRYFSRYELEHLLARAGLEVEAMCGDYELSELGDESPRIVVIAGPGADHP